MPPKRPRRDESDQQHGAAGGKEETLRDRLFDAVNAGVEEAVQEVEEERKQLAEEERTKQLAEERARSITEAREAVVKLKADAAIEVEEMRRKVQEERAALEEEKAAIEKAHIFQRKKVLLNVGGHRFETSLQKSSPRCPPRTLHHCSRVVLISPSTPRARIHTPSIETESTSGTS
jgi:pyruvate-formate lyase